MSNVLNKTYNAIARLLECLWKGKSQFVWILGKFQFSIATLAAGIILCVRCCCWCCALMMMRWCCCRRFHTVVAVAAMWPLCCMTCGVILTLLVAFTLASAIRKFVALNFAQNTWPLIVHMFNLHQFLQWNDANFRVLCGLWLN